MNARPSNAGGRPDQRSLRGDPGSAAAAPEQIHIALGDARSRELYSMSVSWLTWVDAESQVLWGRDTDVVEEIVVGNSTRETANVIYLQSTPSC